MLVFSIRFPLGAGDPRLCWSLFYQVSSWVLVSHLLTKPKEFPVAWRELTEWGRGWVPRVPGPAASAYGVIHYLLSFVLNNSGLSAPLRDAAGTAQELTQRERPLGFLW